MASKKNKKEVFELSDAWAVRSFDKERGYVFSKDCSLTVGFCVSMPEANMLMAADIACKTETDAGMDLHSIIANAINLLDTNYTFHQQDITYFDKNDVPASKYIARSIKRMVGEKEFQKIRTYFFVTAPYVDLSDMNTAEKDIRRIEEIVQSFTTAVGVFEPKRMKLEEWEFYWKSYFACDFRDEKLNKKKVPLDLNFPDRQIGNFSFMGYKTQGDQSVEDYINYRRNTSRTNEFVTRYNCNVYPLTYGVSCYKILNNVIRKADKSIVLKDLSAITRNLGFFLMNTSNEAKAAKNFIDYFEEDENPQAGKASLARVPAFHQFSVYFIFPKEEWNGVKEQVEKAFYEMKLQPSQIDLNVEHHYLSNIGGCINRLKKPVDLFPVVLNEAVTFCNVENGAKQAKNGVILESTTGEMVCVDLIEEPILKGIIENNNGIFVGPSGTGKSFTINKLLASSLERDFFNIILDIGNSYRTQTLLMNSEENQSARYYVSDSTGKQLSFNPFLLPKVDPDNIQGDLGDDFVAELEVLRDLLLRAWNMELKHKNINTAVTLLNLLRKFFKYRYEQNQDYVNFTHFYRFVEKEVAAKNINEKFFDHESFILVMERYLEGKDLGFFFNGETNVFDIKGIQLMVFELEKASDRDDLYRLTLAMIIILSKKIFDQAPHRFKYLIIDEAWRLLEDPFFGDFIKFLYKTIRKKGAGIIIAVQDFADILNSPHSQAILNNSPLQVVLRHSAKLNYLDQNKETLSLTAPMLEAVKSLQSHEVFIKVGSTFSTYLVRATKEENYIYSTTHNVVLVRDREIEYHKMNVMLAIDNLVAKNVI